jgi:hypothetical protein
MYKWYRAWAGQYGVNRTDHVSVVLEGINETGEEIVSVTPSGTDNVWVLIITKKPDAGWLV